MSFHIDGSTFLSELQQSGISYLVVDDLEKIKLMSVGPITRPGANILRFARRGIWSPCPLNASVGGVLICASDFTPFWPGVTVVTNYPELLFRHIVKSFDLNSETMAHEFGKHSIRRVPSPASRSSPEISEKQDTTIHINSKIGEGVSIGVGSFLSNCIVEKGVLIGPNSVIGLDGLGHIRDHKGALIAAPHFGTVRIGPEAVLHSSVVVDRGVFEETTVGGGSVLGAGTHVSHGVKIGKHVFIAHKVEIGGSVLIGNNVTIWSGATIRDNIIIGEDSTIGMGAVVVNNVAPGTTVVGNPAREM